MQEEQLLQRYYTWCEPDGTTNIVSMHVPGGRFIPLVSMRANKNRSDGITAANRIKLIVKANVGLKSGASRLSGSYCRDTFEAAAATTYMGRTDAARPMKRSGAAACSAAT